MLYVLGFACLASSLGILYQKYRVIITGERCRAKIIDIADRDFKISIKGKSAIKHAYVVEIENEQYYTAHGCLFVLLGKRKIGKEIVVYQSKKHRSEVFVLMDFRIEILALILFLVSVGLVIK